MATDVGCGTGEGDAVGVTWDTYVDLGKPAGMTVYPASALAKGGTYVCSTYVLGDPFVMPGNVVGACAACRGLVQMRPHAPPSLRKICMPCALAEGLMIPKPPKLKLPRGVSPFPAPTRPGGRKVRPDPKATTR